MVVDCGDMIEFTGGSMFAGPKDDIVTAIGGLCIWHDRIILGDAAVLFDLRDLGEFLMHTMGCH